MSLRSRTTLAAVAVTFTLSLLPSSSEAAGLRFRVPQPEIQTAQILERVERWRVSLWKGVASIWMKAGARIDDNGRSQS